MSYFLSHINSFHAHTQHDGVLLFRAIGKLRSESSRGRNTVCFLLAWSAWRSLPLTLLLEPFIFLCVGPSSLLFGVTCGVFEAGFFEDTEHTDLKVSILTSHLYLLSFLALVCLSIVGDIVEELVKASISLHCSAVTKHLFFKAAPLQPVMWKEFTHLASKEVIRGTGFV